MRKTLMILLAFLAVAAFAAEEETQKIVVGADISSHSEAWKMMVDQFTEETGIEVEIAEYPFTQWQNNLATEATLKSGLYDVTYIAGAWLPIGTGADYFRQYTDVELDRLGADDIPAFYVNEVDGDHYFIPFSNGITLLILRNDLLTDPDEMAAFESQYGYPLDIPKTEAEYFDQLEFFHRPDDGLYGMIAYGRRDPWLPILFSSMLYARGINYMSWDTLEPSLNTPLGIETLQEFKRQYEYADPASYTAGWFEGNANFRAGANYSITSWTDVLIDSSDPEVSNVVGKLITAPYPGDPPELKGPISQWGYAIPVTTEKVDAAMQFIEFMTSHENHVNAVVNSRAGHIPASFEALRDRRTLERFPGHVEIAYLLENTKFESDSPPIPEGNTIRYEMLTKYLSLLINNEISAEDAAEQFEEELWALLREGGYF